MPVICPTGQVLFKWPCRRGQVASEAGQSWCRSASSEIVEESTAAPDCRGRTRAAHRPAVAAQAGPDSAGRHPSARPTGREGRAAVSRDDGRRETPSQRQSKSPRPVVSRRGLWTLRCSQCAGDLPDVSILLSGRTIRSRDLFKALNRRRLGGGRRRRRFGRRRRSDAGSDLRLGRSARLRCLLHPRTRRRSPHAP